MFTTGTKFLIGSTVVASLAALAYGVTQDGVMGTIGLISAALALAFLAGVNIYTRDSNVLVTPDLVPEQTPAAQGRSRLQRLAVRVRPRRRHHRRRTRLVPGDHHHRTPGVARRRCRVDDPGLGRTCVGRQRPQLRRAQPDRQPVRVPDRRRRSPSASSCTRSAASCCGCRRRTPCWRSASSPRSCWRSPSCSPTGPRSSTARSISVIVIGAVGAGRRWCGGRHQRRARDRTARDHRRRCARGSVRDPEETHADENASQSRGRHGERRRPRHARPTTAPCRYDLNGPLTRRARATPSTCRGPRRATWCSSTNRSEHRRLTFDFGTMARPRRRRRRRVHPEPGLHDARRDQR